jgi:hypothetical protein
MSLLKDSECLVKSFNEFVAEWRLDAVVHIRSAHWALHLQRVLKLKLEDAIVTEMMETRDHDA